MRDGTVRSRVEVVPLRTGEANRGRITSKGRGQGLKRKVGSHRQAVDKTHEEMEEKEMGL